MLGDSVSKASLFVLKMAILTPVLICVYVPPVFLPLLKMASGILRTSFNLNVLFKGLISNYNPTGAKTSTSEDIILSISS